MQLLHGYRSQRQYKKVFFFWQTTNPYYHFQVHPLFDKAESKNKLLRSVAGGGVEQIGQLQARWDKFELMMESHELMVKEQVSNPTLYSLATVKHLKLIKAKQGSASVILPFLYIVIARLPYKAF